MVPTSRAKIIIEGAQIPAAIIFLYTKVKVELFVPLSQCFRCLMFGHFPPHCKQTHGICRECFFLHPREEKCIVLKCANCKQPHSATELEFPARKRAFAIQKCMTVENLSRVEVKAKLPALFEKQCPNSSNF